VASCARISAEKAKKRRYKPCPSGHHGPW
jgi:hypothetical protein